MQRKEPAAKRVLLLNDLWSRIDPTVARTAREVAFREASRVTGHFYSVLLQDDHAKRFLDHHVVEERLSRSMEAWLQSIFLEPPAGDYERWIENQAQIGRVHARIEVPPILVSHGMRVIKRELFDALLGEPSLPELRTQTVLFTSELLDFALDCINDAFFEGMAQNVRQNQSLRLFMAGPRLALECERQKAQLFNWHRNVVSSALSLRDRKGTLPSLENSELTLWIKHKAEFTLGDSAEASALLAGLETLETRFRDVLEDSADGNFGAGHLEKLDEAVTSLAFKLEGVADRVVGTEAGFDALTQVLNRRYMPTILQQEVALSREHGKPFALLVIDIDHFKQINDTYGHDNGDRVLAQVAHVLAASVRGGDFVFRYGGEEFLVLLAEVDRAIARGKAEQIREAVETLRCDTEELKDHQLTVSIGVSVHDGHPDYERALRAADQALYAAKADGRNRVCEASEKDRACMPTDRVREPAGVR